MTEQVLTPSLQMAWSQAPWDEAVCGFPVVQITAIKVLGAQAAADFQAFERLREALGVGLVSCRLPHDCLRESMLLEDHGFRFIEMTYAPELALRDFKPPSGAGMLAVDRAVEADMTGLLDIAGTAFHSERFKMDPRLDPAVSDRRFQNWVASSLHHPRQQLYVVRDAGTQVAFFVTEYLGDGTCYWHLNAVSPALQGRGLGRRVWASMMNQAAAEGAQRVRTNIAARNHRVLNLYARLGFSFSPPSMTFHWVRPKG